MSSGRLAIEALMSLAYCLGSSSCAQRFGVSMGSNKNLQVRLFATHQVLATVSGLLAHGGVGEVGEVSVVELEVAASGLVERVDLGAVAGSEVGKELVQVGVDFGRDGRATTAEVAHRRGRDRDLDVVVLVGGCVACERVCERFWVSARAEREHVGTLTDKGLEVLKVGDLDVVGVTKLGGDGQGRGHTTFLLFEGCEKRGEGRVRR